MSETRPERSLLERKQSRAKQAIRQAALELFSERGFDAVSVTDIAERAEVGRTTFFRYFGDKQEVLFPAEDEEAQLAPADANPLRRDIGSSLPDALNCARALVTRFVGQITADPEGYITHQRLVNGQPELYARSLVKQRRHADLLAEQLTVWGATPSVARQAAELAMACFYTGQAESGDDPRTIKRHVARAFDRICS